MSASAQGVSLHRLHKWSSLANNHRLKMCAILQDLTPMLCLTPMLIYKGAGPALIDLMGGQVDMLFDQLSASSNFIRTGKLRALVDRTACQLVRPSDRLSIG